MNDYREIITIELGKRGGKPCIRRMRITVYDILGWLAAGMTNEENWNKFLGSPPQIFWLRCGNASVGEIERKLCHPADDLLFDFLAGGLGRVAGSDVNEVSDKSLRGQTIH